MVGINFTLYFMEVSSAALIFFYRSTFQDSKIVQRSISYFGTTFGAYFLNLYRFCLTLAVALFDKGRSCGAIRNFLWTLFFGCGSCISIRGHVHPSVGPLVSWLVGLSVCPSVGWLVRLLVGWSVCWSVMLL